MNPLWLRQVRGVLALELRRSLFSGRAIPLYFLALLPVVLVTLFVVLALLFGDPDDADTLRDFGSLALGYAGLYQFILRALLYFGCVWMFMNLFRGEILDRSLHYYFLSPIRREVLVAGKFLSGFAATSLFFVASTVACMVILYSYFGVGSALRHLLAGPGLGQFVSYVGVTLMACLGYGAVFLVMGLFFRSPAIPAVLIWVWEAANPFLPALLKKASVIFYLQSLLPVKLPGSVFELVADPVSAWLAVPGFVLFTGVTLVIAGLRIRHMEISYAAD